MRRDETRSHRRRTARLARACSLGAALTALLLAPVRPVTAQTTREEPGMSGMHGMEWGRELFLLSEVLEFVPGGIDRPVRYDLVGWAGGASKRLWAKADGEHGTRAGGGETAVQLLYGRQLTAWWDGQLGVKLDAHYGEGSTSTRTSLALGVQGLAPGWFEVEPTLFVSQDGDVSASLEASYDLLFTQRLVLQPSLETTVAAQAVPAFGVGSGVNDVELGLRLRYELRRELAPYVGFTWARRLGGTADLAHASGTPVREVSLVAGLRLWR